tara:strand:- start:303 stop:590 length:288 start_codon:yes stop_codon:yes gene_type:complete
MKQISKGQVSIAGYFCTLYEAAYHNFNTAIVTEPAVAHLSINVEHVSLSKGEFVLHHDIGGTCRQDFMRTGYFEDTGRKASYGFIKDQPIWRIKR